MGLVQRRVVLGAAAAMVLTLGAACSGGDEPAEVPPVSQPPDVPSLAGVPSVAPEHVPVLDAYQAFVGRAAEAFNRGDPDYPALAEYADGPALVRTRAAIEQHVANGRIYQGSPEITSVEVTHFDPDAPPEDPNAEVLACVDVTDYVLVYEEGASPVPVERGLERYQATAQLWRTENERWLVVDFEELPETAC